MCLSSNRKQTLYFSSKLNHRQLDNLFTASFPSKYNRISIPTCLLSSSLLFLSASFAPMMSRRQSFTSVDSPVRMDGGNSSATQNVNSDFANKLRSLDALFIFDVSALSSFHQDKAYDIAVFFKDLFLQNSRADFSVPAPFANASFAHALDDAVRNHRTDQIHEILRSRLFNSKQVRDATSATSKVFAAICLATDSSKNSLSAKQAYALAASFICVSSNTDIRQLLVDSIAGMRIESDKLLGLTKTGHESHFIQCCLLMALILVSFSPSSPTTDQPVHQTTDENRFDIRDLASKLTNANLASTPFVSPKRHKISFTDPVRTTKPLGGRNDSRSDVSELLKLREQIASAPQQAQLDTHRRAAAAKERAIAATTSALLSPSPTKVPASMKSPRKSKRSRTPIPSDSSQSESDDDEPDDFASLDSEEKKPREEAADVLFVNSVRASNQDAKERAWRAFHNPDEGKPYQTFNTSVEQVAAIGTYDSLLELVQSLPTMDHQAPNFTVTYDTTIALAHSFNTLCQTRLRGTIPTLNQVQMLVYHKTSNLKIGVALIDINGIPCHFYRSRKVDTTTLPSVAQVFNPSGISELECLGESLIARNIFPVTPDHWKGFMRSTALKAVANPVSFLVYSDAQNGQLRVRAVEAYSARFRQLMLNVLGSNWKDHKYHISLWAMLLIFHLGRWTHATTMRKLDLLLDNFDREWETHYSNRVRDNQYLALIFPQALELLDYRCPKGHRGYCEQVCDICDRSSLVSTVTDSTDDVSDSSHKQAIDDWHKALNIWTLDEKKKGTADTSRKAFEKIRPFPKVSSTSSKKPQRLDRKSLAHLQNKIHPHIPFDLTE